MKKHHEIKDMHFSGDSVVLTIDGDVKKYRLKDFSSEISPSGYGIHWPLIDEDIAIDGLLGIVHQKKQKRKTA